MWMLLAALAANADEPKVQVSQGMAGGVVANEDETGALIAPFTLRVQHRALVYDQGAAFVTGDRADYLLWQGVGLMRPTGDLRPYGTIGYVLGVRGAQSEPAGGLLGLGAQVTTGLQWTPIRTCEAFALDAQVSGATCGNEPVLMAGIGPRWQYGRACGRN